MIYLFEFMERMRKAVMDRLLKRRIEQGAGII